VSDRGLYCKEPVQVPCLLEPSYLTPKEQDLFATF